MPTYGTNTPWVQDEHGGRVAGFPPGRTVQGMAGELAPSLSLCAWGRWMPPCPPPVGHNVSHGAMLCLPQLHPLLFPAWVHASPGAILCFLQRESISCWLHSYGFPGISACPIRHAIVHCQMHAAALSDACRCVDRCMPLRWLRHRGAFLGAARCLAGGMCLVREWGTACSGHGGGHPPPWQERWTGCGAPSSAPCYGGRRAISRG